VLKTYSRTHAVCGANARYTFSLRILMIAHHLWSFSYPTSGDNSRFWC